MNKKDVKKALITIKPKMKAEIAKAILQFSTGWCDGSNAYEDITYELQALIVTAFESHTSFDTALSDDEDYEGTVIEQVYDTLSEWIDDFHSALATAAKQWKEK